MRLNLRDIIHTPGAALPFAFALDLSGLDFYGERPQGLDYVIGSVHGLMQDGRR